MEMTELAAKKREQGRPTFKLSFLRDPIHHRVGIDLRMQVPGFDGYLTALNSSAQSGRLFDG